MVFRQILLPILVLVAINSRFGLAVPHQTIRFSFEKYVMEYAGTPIEDSKDCSDGKNHCPDGQTCCKIETKKGYGCCPYPDAVCCKGTLVCCPHAMTCCGLYRCCPFPNAVCCKDGRRCCLDGTQCCKDGSGCCPHGTQCVPGGCDPIPHFLPMLMGLPEVNNMEKALMMTWKVKQSISTDNYIPTVSRHKLTKTAIVQPWRSIFERANMYDVKFPRLSVCQSRLIRRHGSLLLTIYLPFFLIQFLLFKLFIIN